MGGLLALVLAIVIISAVVGVIAQFLNKLNEANAPPPRRVPPRGGPRPPRAADRDMDRFLAEIDRLRKKKEQAADGQQAESPPAAAPPVAKPVRPADRQSDRGKPRVVAELAGPPPEQSRRRPEPDDAGFVIPTAASAPPSAAKTDDLPVATVVDPSALPAAVAPATALSPISALVRLAQLPPRGRPAAQTPMGKNLAALLAGGQGMALAVVLQEALGPPKCKQRQPQRTEG